MLIVHNRIARSERACGRCTSSRTRTRRTASSQVYAGRACFRKIKRQCVPETCSTRPACSSRCTWLAGRPASATWSCSNTSSLLSRRMELKSYVPSYLLRMFESGRTWTDIWFAGHDYVGSLTRTATRRATRRWHSTVRYRSTIRARRQYHGTVFEEYLPHLGYASLMRKREFR